MCEQLCAWGKRVAKDGLYDLDGARFFAGKKQVSAKKKKAVTATVSARKMPWSLDYIAAVKLWTDRYLNRHTSHNGPPGGGRGGGCRRCCFRRRVQTKQCKQRIQIL